ncbi:hypothetical protein [Thermaerobacillus caldiproteolyticus]|uniref:Uncharacterized protein n=1 Tax=Thermaerobacillus caldiproteolyticus TaxID=247480 RepID=A0A7V9Z796_9BACL|nr:hypothetical protein [Anoxybacillus caldiproteolyticus]MBA2875372.1 hypothetical protein [Anoxybacillus caldiproteolyticus]QPA32670.1 hypothetical protein ISX45_07030 [Anoxybacillus caldiproteolyticus]
MREYVREFFSAKDVIAAAVTAGASFIASIVQATDISIVVPLLSVFFFISLASL